MTAQKPIASYVGSQPEEFSARLLSGLDDPFLRDLPEASLNVFQSGGFVSTFDRHLGDDTARLTLIGVTDSLGNPVAVLPFLRKKKLGIPILEGMDLGLVDYFAPTFFRRSPLTVEGTRRLWDAVCAAVPGVSAVIFKKMPKLQYGRPHALTNADFVRPMSAAAVTLRLVDADGRRFQPAKMSLAREVRRKSKKLDAIGPLTFTEAVTQEEVDAAMDTLVAFRTARFAELKRPDPLLDQRVVRFYRDLARRDGAAPLARLLTLRAGDYTVAVVYGFSFGGAFTLIVPAITTCKKTLVGSPGLVALYRTLDWCAANGYDVFDLSVGQLGYKSRFEAETVELYECQRALSPLGLVVVAEGAARRFVRHLGTSRPGLRAALERVVHLVYNFRERGRNV